MSGAGLVEHVAHVEHLKVPRRGVVDRPDTIAFR
jgi:hypothetical protein